MYALPPSLPPFNHRSSTTSHGAGPQSATPLEALLYARFVFTHLLSQRRPNSSSRLRSYKLDGPGIVYIVGRVRTTVYNSYIAKQTSHDDFLDALEVKVGHSKNFKARRCAYKRCAGKHTLFWHATYTTRNRMLLEISAPPFVPFLCMQDATSRVLQFCVGGRISGCGRHCGEVPRGPGGDEFRQGPAGLIPASSRDLNRKHDSFANGSV
ncbi:hypothetical protein B0H11DRAFT_1903811 [Mycena galericulata]|nr:hypothetical protein B0H11DRAFT_1903811 [Mycena galericulata]